MSTDIEGAINTRTRSSQLRITDLRVANLSGVPFRSSIVRIDTNQGITGYGEVRDGASKTYALMLKQRLVGENPCNVDKLFRMVKQFGHHGRQGGGVSGVEMALMDLAGKAYDVPVYALMGGKFRDSVLCYADTPACRSPNQMAERLVERRERGYKWLKMDVGTNLLWDVPGALIAPPGARDDKTTMHPFTGIQVTSRGIERLVDYVATVRGTLGYDIPLAIDHLGHMGLDSCLRLGQAFEPFTLAWVEDLLPWQLTEQWKQLTARHKYPHLYRRGHLFERELQASPRPRGSAGGPSRPGHRRRDRRDQEDRGSGPGARRSHGAASCGVTNSDPGQCAHRGSHREFPRTRAPRCRCRPLGRARDRFGHPPRPRRLHLGP